MQLWPKAYSFLTILSVSRPRQPARAFFTQDEVKHLLFARAPRAAHVKRRRDEIDRWIDRTKANKDIKHVYRAVIVLLSPPTTLQTRRGPSRGRASGRGRSTSVGRALLRAETCSSRTEERSEDGARRPARSRRPERVVRALVPVVAAAGRAPSCGRRLQTHDEKSAVSEGANRRAKRGIRGPHDLPNHRRAPPSSQEDRPVRRRARAIAPRLQRGPCSPGRAPRGRGSRSWSPDFSARACGDRARTAPEKQLQSRHERVILDAAHTPCTCVGIRRSTGAALEKSWEGP